MLLQDILPFWINHTLDHRDCGFLGRISTNLRVVKDAPKAGVLNSRILWTFSAAYRLYRDDAYRVLADRAFDYMLKYFWDYRYSGLYFTVDANGAVGDTRKHLYNLAFGIYGLSEYYRATGNYESLDRAIRMFKLIEERCYDPDNRGYLEAFTREWHPAADLRLGGGDMNESKSMNTHLHLLEAYTNLFRVWPDERLRRALAELIEVMAQKIADSQTGHFRLYFDEAWNPKSGRISFGHDIEGSWLLCEAAEAISEKDILTSTRALAVRMAEAVYGEGLDPECGGLFNEQEDGCVLDEGAKVWWVQCEALVGFLNAFQLTGKPCFFDAALAIWKFSVEYLSDKVHGEWYDTVSRQGKPDESLDKVGPWKCPYHNGRACMEAVSRLNAIIT
jgi:mannobiose 2-epimerase